ncbi:sigma-54 interaction domain-containing protein [Paenibacillus sp. An7]|uniref:sigma-54 interaction domain-containing protein n=1 Tax=Paenibacillus sp. An7 TaxID=2689577 RepID=UPI00135A4C93|nr:sigma 54-interacting transcriptional regulator [Paenibacillus sp. An7]
MTNTEISGKSHGQNDQNESPSTLFVTDRFGNILISNEFTAITLGIPLEEILRSNVMDLVSAGYYDYSITMEAIKTKKRVTKKINTNRGFGILSTSIPILEPDGEIQLVVTTSNKSSIEESKREAQESELINKEIDKTVSPPDIVAESIAMKQIIKACDQIAPYDSKILITGESGTGKEVIANYIHQKSNRRNGPFVTLNCAAIPNSLFEYEMFGYEDGVYDRNSKSKIGLIETAHQGILFLDELSEMPLDMQTKLLRVIETNELRRVGGIENIKVDCRFIAATNCDLWKLVKQGKFRQDLFYRINVIPIHIPPLRDRKLDIVGLVSRFIDEFNQKYNKQFLLSAEEFQHILSLSWPGNVRELRNYVERLIVINSLPLKKMNEMVTDWFALDHFINNNQTQFHSLKDFTTITEGRYIEKVLDSCQGNISEAAQKLDIHRSVIYRKLKKMEEILKDEH